MTLVTEDTAEEAGELDDVSTFIRDCFAAVLEKPAEQISVKADLFADEGGSSLDYFAIIAALQREFGVPFPTDAGAGLSSVSALSDYVKEQLKNVDKTD
jgi:acyl carrier protein